MPVHVATLARRDRPAGGRGSVRGGSPTLPALPTVVLVTFLVTVLVALLGVVGGIRGVAPTAVAVAAVAPEAPQGALAPAYASDEVEDTGDPLAMEIDQVTPDVLLAAPEATVRVGGTVTNTTDEPWTSVRVYPLVSPAPMTSPAELAEAAAEEPDSFIGNRITTDGLFDRSITTLAPGETRRFTLTLPASSFGITGGPGVYWLGVHALGETSEGRSSNAAGKARTFLPVLPAQQATAAVPTTVVVPLRERVVTTADGAVADTDRWAELLGPEGRLREIADLAADPAADSVSWLLDPALLDVAYRLAVGNPGRDIGPSEPDADEAPEEPDEPATADPGTAPTADADDAPTEEDEELAELAADWLADVVAALEDADVLALPYGDVDLEGAVQRDVRIYTTARALSTDALERYGLTGRPAVAPPPTEGLTPTALDVLTDETALLADDRLPEGSLGDGEVVGALGDVTVVAADASAASGGPRPGPTTSSLQVRQRTAAETVVEDLVGSTSTSRVVVLPSAWDPAGEGLPVAGVGPNAVAPVPLSTLQPATLAPVTADVVVTDAAAADVVPGTLVAAARELVVTGQRLDRVLPDNDTLSEQVAREASLAVSYADRDDPAAAAASLRGASDDIDAMLGRITVEVPSAITLASETGRFSARVVNGLDQTIEVVVRAGGGRGITVDSSEPLTVPAGGSTTVLLDTRLELLGVYDVEVAVADVDGTALGTPTTTRLRSAAVSDVIWIVIGVAFVLLTGATSIWLRRRRERG